MALSFHAPSPHKNILEPELPRLYPPFSFAILHRLLETIRVAQTVSPAQRLTPWPFQNERPPGPINGVGHGGEER